MTEMTVMKMEMAVHVSGPKEGEHPSVMHVEFIPSFREWRFDPPYTFEEFDAQLKEKINSFIGLPLNDQSIRALEVTINDFVSSIFRMRMVHVATEGEPGAPV